ncbi:hypothetical protein GGS23DRAFT_575557 [Durotheca rogersii]|uniref:uncharacterized protein n=1 Tax=Durotheca rogersii TaxID=419775 RepID=UPI00221F9091|nr:uncharacterized protein GGS23DRAFT_575557 [Durotheca rogersii]KAI5861548.1 hypothetical protein GGS23DRAFT_575557 [Durotheca rogersii]
MALARSASGPGGLSINTSSANLFGSGSNQPAPGGPFGSGPSVTPAGTPQPPSFGGSLFGGSTAATSQPSQTTTSLLGGGGGAGAGTNTTSQPQQQAGSLFGNTQQTQPQTQPQAQTSNPGSLFGGGTAGQAPSVGVSSGGGLFNSSARPSQPAPVTTGTTGLFGQSTQPKPSLFGGSLSQPAQPQPNPLAQSQQPQAGFGLGASLGLGLTMGQLSNQPTVPGVRIDVSNLKGTTRFNDLQEDLQKKIEQVDVFIQQQMQNKDQVESFMPGHREMLESIPNDVDFVERKYEGARNALQSAAQAIDAARALVGQDVDHARLSFRAIDNLKLPEQYHTPGLWSPRQQAGGTAANAEADGQDLVGFFSQAADEMEEQMRRYDGNMTEIEMHLRGVSDGLVEELQKVMAAKGGAPPGPDEKVRELGVVFREFEHGILKVASDVASAREGMTRLQLGEFAAADGNRSGVY